MLNFVGIIIQISGYGEISWRRSSFEHFKLSVSWCTDHKQIFHCILLFNYVTVVLDLERGNQLYRCLEIWVRKTRPNIGLTFVFLRLSGFWRKERNSRFLHFYLATSWTFSIRNFTEKGKYLITKKIEFENREKLNIERFYKFLRTINFWCKIRSSRFFKH